jgi:monoamine oxidase
MVQALAKTLDIRLNAEVKTIRLEKQRGEVTVQLSNGESLTADYLVCTLPLGVLKSRAVQFQPALPQCKMASIRALGFGCLNKVALLFPAVFWDAVDFVGHAAESRGQWVLFADLSR